MGIIHRHVPSLFWICLFFTLFSCIFSRTWKWEQLIPLFIIGFFYSIWIFQRKKEISETLQSQRIKYTFSRGIFLFVLLLILLYSFEFAMPYFIYKDFTRSKVYSLQPELLKKVMEIAKPLKIYCLYNPDDPKKLILKNYLDIIKKENSLFQIVYEDYRYSSIAKTLKLDRNRRTVFEYNQRNFIFQDFDENFTQKYIYSCLIRVLKNKIPVIGWVNGHGEKQIIGKRANCNQLKEAMENQGFSFGYTDLINPVESKFDCLVVAGPEKEYSPEELKHLTEFLKLGKGLFLMLEPEPSAGFQEWLKKWKFIIEKDILVDGKGTLAGGGPFSVIAGHYGIHEALHNFSFNTFFNTVRSVYFDKKVENREFLGESQKRIYYDFRFLVKSSLGCFSIPWDGKDNSISKKALKSNTVQLGASLKLERENSRDIRIVVIGDSDFITDSFLGFAGNRELFFSLANWVMETELPVKMKPDITRNVRFVMTEMDHVFLKFFTFGFWPSIFLGLGISFYMQRRKTSVRND